VVLPARLLADKGVREFVVAARCLRERGVAARCVLVGRHDTQNPGAISGEELAGWLQDGCIEWWGHRDDMPAVLAAATVVCLPSYREGMPKALLEAGAVGRAVVTTDVPGCRDVVGSGVSGELVAPRDGVALADALERLLGDPARRAAFAAALHDRVATQFGIDRVAADTLRLYERVLDGRGAGAATP
jgi:glycosyltransferase involved in cell wall biosynthesis